MKLKTRQLAAASVLALGLGAAVALPASAEPPPPSTPTIEATFAEDAVAYGTSPVLNGFVEGADDETQYTIANLFRQEGDDWVYYNAPEWKTPANGPFQFTYRDNLPSGWYRAVPEVNWDPTPEQWGNVVTGDLQYVLVYPDLRDFAFQPRVTPLGVAPTLNGTAASWNSDLFDIEVALYAADSDGNPVGEPVEGPTSELPGDDGALLRTFSSGLPVGNYVAKISVSLKELTDSVDDPLQVVFADLVIADPQITWAEFEPMVVFADQDGTATGNLFGAVDSWPGENYWLTSELYAADENGAPTGDMLQNPEWLTEVGEDDSFSFTYPGLLPGEYVAIPSVVSEEPYAVQYDTTAHLTVLHMPELVLGSWLQNPISVAQGATTTATLSGTVEHWVPGLQLGVVATPQDQVARDAGIPADVVVDEDGNFTATFDDLGTGVYSVVATLLYEDDTPVPGQSVNAQDLIISEFGSVAFAKASVSNVCPATTATATLEGAIVNYGGQTVTATIDEGKAVPVTVGEDGTFELAFEGLKEGTHTATVTMGEGEDAVQYEGDLVVKASISSCASKPGGELPKTGAFVLPLILLGTGAAGGGYLLSRRSRKI